MSNSLTQTWMMQILTAQTWKIPNSMMAPTFRERRNMDKADNVHDADFKDVTCPDGTDNDLLP